MNERQNIINKFFNQMKNKFLKLMALFVASAFVGNAGAQNWTPSEVGEGTYYLYNVGSNKFLTSGNWWGTHAALDTDGMPVTLVGSGNTYTISTAVAFSGRFLGDNAYMDNANAAQWTFTEVGNGCYTMKCFKDGADHYFVYVSNVNADLTTETPTDENGYWQLVSKEQLIANLNYATKASPIEASFYMTNPKVRRNWPKAIDGTGLSDNGSFNTNAEGLYDGGCTSYGQYQKQFDNYQSLNVRNGVYKVSVKGFYRTSTNHTAVPYLYANEGKSNLKLKGDIGGDNATQATKALVNDTYLVDPVTITVTDGNLRVGVKSDASCDWTTFREFTLLYVGTILKDAEAFVSGTKLEANKWYCYNVSQETEFSISADDLSNIAYLVNDGTMLVEDANATETSVFSSTQTLSAGTYYFKSSVAQTLSISPNVLPTSVTLNVEEVALNAASNTFALTAVVGEAGAPQDVVWTSANTNVATVNNGVVTGVTPGTTVIKATAYGYDDVYAEATVTVTYAETVVPEYVNDGAKRICYTYGENLIKNGSFEYANGFYGWLAADNKNLSSNKFEIVTDGANKHLKAKTHGGSTDAGSIGTGWPIEAGKTYVFSYRVKGGSAGNSEFHKVTLTNTLGTETKQISDNATPVTTGWTAVKYEFTNTDGYKFLQFRARWLNSNTEFDDFYLCEAIATEEIGNVDYITENVPTVNIGEGAFQYSQTSIDAAKSLVQGEATVEDVQNAYDAMMALNAPDEDEAFNLVLKYNGWTYDGKAVTYIENDRADHGLYNIKYSADPNVNYAQAFTFTPIEGKANCYTLSMTDVDGNERYISTGVPYGGNTSQIRTTTDATKALAVKVIATTTDGIWNLYNTEANNYIGSQDAGVFTVNSHIDFALKPATKAEVTLKVTDLGWATLMLPFNAEIPAGVEVWSCTGEENGVLTLEAVESIAANTPYVVSGEVGEYTFADYGLAKQEAYAGAMLTGTYAADAAPVDSYVLQNGANGFGFYKVAEEKQPTVGAYRCYINASESAAPMFSLERGEGTTSIDNVQLSKDSVVIYDLAGRRVEKMEKGIYIVKGRKVIR